MKLSWIYIIFNARPINHLSIQEVTILETSYKNGNERNFKLYEHVAKPHFLIFVMKAKYKNIIK